MLRIFLGPNYNHIAFSTPAYFLYLIKIKKLSLPLIKNNDLKTYGGEETHIYAFITAAPNESEWSTVHRGTFSMRTVPGTQWAGASLHTRARMLAMLSPVWN
jgi:hypothetical protein